jgi:hypothetical protein
MRLFPGGGQFGQNLEVLGFVERAARRLRVHCAISERHGCCARCALAADEIVAGSFPSMLVNGIPLGRSSCLMQGYYDPGSEICISEKDLE